MLAMLFSLSCNAVPRGCGAVYATVLDISCQILCQITLTKYSPNPPSAAVHDPEDVELSILKQRLARRLVEEGQTDESVRGLDLVELTKVRSPFTHFTLVHHCVCNSVVRACAWWLQKGPADTTSNCSGPG
jgi:hypothetical protein